MYTPTSEDKDCVTCMLCQHSVSAWEATDVPWCVRAGRVRAKTSMADEAGLQGHPREEAPGLPILHGRAGRSAKNAAAAAGGSGARGDWLRLTISPEQEAQASAAGPSAKAAGGAKKCVVPRRFPCALLTRSPRRPTRSAKSKTAHPLTESQSSTDAQQAQPPSPAKAVPPSKTSKTRAPASRARGKRDTVVSNAVPAAASESEKENDPPEPAQEVAQGPPRAGAAKGKGGNGKATRAGKGRKTVTAAPVEPESEVEEPSEQEAVAPMATGEAQAQVVEAAGEDHDMEVDQAPALMATKKGRVSRAPRATTAKTIKGGKVAASKGKKGKAPATEEVESVPSAADADDPARTPRQQDGPSVHDEYIKQAAHDARVVLDSLGGTPSGRAPKPTVPKPAPPPSDEHIADDDYIKQAALEARAVLDNLGAASSRRTPRAAPLKSVPLPPQPDASANDPFNATPSTAQGPPPLPAEDMQLTEEQADMTVEEFLRYELGLRYEELKEQGERAIAEWVERSAKARDVIAGL